MQRLISAGLQPGEKQSRGIATEQYINLRPVKLYRGADCQLKEKGPEHIDFVVVRENNEGLYTGSGGFVFKGTPHEVAIRESVNTRCGVDRCLKYAFELAQKQRDAQPAIWSDQLQRGDGKQPARELPGAFGRDAFCLETGCFKVPQQVYAIKK